MRHVECGVTARYVSDPIDVVIFNFTDKNLHNNPADLAFIYDATVREILRQDVRSILRELPNDAVVFVISDHGFTPVPTTPLPVPNGVITDSGDVKYRVGRLKAPLEGDDAKNGVTFKVGDLGIPDKIRKPNGAEWSFNHVLFPRPGVTLKRPQGPFSPDRYTHGGLSMAECFIPLVVLGPKIEFEPPFELTGLRFEGPLDRESTDRHPCPGEGECPSAGGSSFPAPGGCWARCDPAPQGGFRRTRARV